MSWFHSQELIPGIVDGLIAGIILLLLVKFGPRIIRRLKRPLLSAIGKVVRTLSIKRLLGIEELSQRIQFLDRKLDENLDIILKLMSSMEDKFNNLKDRVTQLEAKSNPEDPPSEEDQ